MDDKQEKEFLTDLGDSELKVVAQEWAVKMGWAPERAEVNCRAWLHRIRERVKKEQAHLNMIYALQKRNSRIRKFTLSGVLPESLADMEGE